MDRSALNLVLAYCCRRNHPCKIFGDWLNDVDSVGVKNGGFPLSKPSAVLTQLRSE